MASSWLHTVNIARIESDSFCFFVISFFRYGKAKRRTSIPSVFR